MLGVLDVSDHHRYGPRTFIVGPGGPTREILLNFARESGEKPELPRSGERNEHHLEALSSPSLGSGG